MNEVDRPSNFSQSPGVRGGTRLAIAIAAALLAGAGSVSFAVVSARAATGASSNASAQSYRYVPASTTGLTISSSPALASSDGSGSPIVTQSQPVVSDGESSPFLSGGAASEYAEADPNGNSYACAGIVQQGGQVELSSNDSACTTSGNTTSSVDLAQSPGAGSTISSLGDVTLNFDSVTTFAEDVGGQQSGSSSISGGSVTATPLGGNPVTEPLAVSSSPNQSLLPAVASAISSSGNPEVSALASAVGSLSNNLLLETNVQTSADGVLSVIVIEERDLAATGGSADFAIATVGPNSIAGSTSGTGTGSGSGSGGTTAAGTEGTGTNGEGPTVTSISPDTGPTTGGTLVTIAGSGLSGATGVSFGLVPASGFVVLGNGSVLATSPTGTGAVDVGVQTPAGISAATPNDRFRYTGSTVVTGSGATASPTTCPVGEVITGYLNANPVHWALTVKTLAIGTAVLGRVAESNRLVVSEKAKVSTAHLVRFADNRPSDGLLTGQIVYRNHVVVHNIYRVQSVPVCASAAAATIHPIVFQFKVSAARAGIGVGGGVYSGGQRAQSFAIRIESGHRATFTDYTPLVGKVTADIYKPGSKDKTVLASATVTSR